MKTDNLSNVHLSSSTVGPPTVSLTAPIPMGIADSGCTGHFLPPNTPVLSCIPTTTPITIANPNGTLMTSTHDAILNIPELPLNARQAHIVPDLATRPLISIGKLCDAGCFVQFMSTDVTIQTADSTIHGTRDPVSNLLAITIIYSSDYD